MAEAAYAEVPKLEADETPNEAEQTGNTKTKIVTAAALGAVGVGAALAEHYGLIPKGWPPPTYSFKHPWVGYYAAWAASKYRGYKAGKTYGVALLADGAAEVVQDIHNRPDHHPFHWANIGDGAQNHNAHNKDNVADLVLCLGGAALFDFQIRGGTAWLRAKAGNFRSRLFARGQPAGSPSPVD